LKFLCFLFKINFLIFFITNNFLKIKKYYFNIFLYKKYFEKKNHIPTLPPLLYMAVATLSYLEATRHSNQDCQKYFFNITWNI